MSYEPDGLVSALPFLPYRFTYTDIQDFHASFYTNRVDQKSLAGIRYTLPSRQHFGI